MKNLPYLDKPLLPLAVALRSMLAETETKIATVAPGEKTPAPAVLGERLTPRQSPSPS